MPSTAGWIAFALVSLGMVGARAAMADEMRRLADYVVPDARR